MSRSEPVPQGEEGRPGASRRRRLLRGLWLAGAGLGLLLGVHLPPVKHLVGGLLARAVGTAVGGETRFERFDYRLWEPSSPKRWPRPWARR